MKKFLNKVDSVCTWAAVGLFILIAVIMTLNVISRLFSGGIPWYMEGSQYLNIWCVFITSIGLCAANDHLRIDAIEGVVKGGVKKWIQVIISLCTAYFFIMLGIAFFSLAMKSRQAISTMPSLKMSLVYWPVPVFCFLNAAATLLRGFYNFREFGKEGND